MCKRSSATRELLKHRAHEDEARNGHQDRVLHRARGAVAAPDLVRDVEELVDRYKIQIDPDKAEEKADAANCDADWETREQSKRQRDEHVRADVLIEVVEQKFRHLFSALLFLRCRI
jgi:hypothetical protein